ncbi:hypothetical protein EVAR_71115_1 [Eumeta japonica]|uniref:Uncharacterized protein n=1 Tax=Eumeta variegata TaxID=151549 RepID=A0A4C2AFP4_EUMVA|nr:hypothetical protein EVAR_71115_1 [Eumeta japonica]
MLAPLHQYGREINFSSFLSINVIFNPGHVFDSDPNILDSDPVPTIVFDPSPILNFDSGLAFDSDPGPVPDSALRPAFNHSSTFNKARGNPFHNVSFVAYCRAVTYFTEQCSQSPPIAPSFWQFYTNAVGLLTTVISDALAAPEVGSRPTPDIGDPPASAPSNPLRGSVPP